MGQHGFARDMDFEEVLKTEKMHQYILRSNPETLEKFPFAFELMVRYEIKENVLQVTYQVTNVDQEEMLFGLGGHPAFICDYSTGDYEICFEEEEDNVQFLKLNHGLVAKENGENRIQDKKIPLQANTFEEDAIIMKNLNSQKVTLKNKKTGEKQLEFYFKEFPYLALWAKKGAPFVCIEPWQNTADRIDSTGEFKTKENILTLAPKQNFQCSYQIKFF